MSGRGIDSLSSDCDYTLALFQAFHDNQLGITALQDGSAPGEIQNLPAFTLVDDVEERLGPLECRRAIDGSDDGALTILVFHAARSLKVQARTLSATS